MQTINFDQFTAVELRIGTITRFAEVFPEGAQACL